VLWPLNVIGFDKELAAELVVPISNYPLQNRGRTPKGSAPR
jgi:hypothetical protein